MLTKAKAINHSAYFSKLDQQLSRIFSLAPNDLHLPMFTNVYKLLTRPLKSLPFIYILPVSFMITLMMYLLFGTLLIRLVSLLQHGF